MVKAIQPSCMLQYGENSDALEYELGLMQVEPAYGADPDDFDDDVLDDEDDDDEFEDDDDDDGFDDDPEGDDLDDDI